MPSPKSGTVVEDLKGAISEIKGGGLLEDSLGFGSGEVSFLLVVKGGDELGGEVFSTSELRENDLFKLGELGGGWGGVQGLHVDDLHGGLVGEFFSPWLHLGL